ncbi:MAG: triose-phosphate isomerase [Cetobacterium sp.]|uniref:triose-phosphate isomerase n=1 Tax=unclassified Cetobacterium TaxID=2630983 RepID=UPI00163D0997|nr:triose-phosphate isomerase [Cetobacterium sp. 2A]MBC2855975.1 triose-phosphate isomerase [Cetobacterium sp. 2A]
MRKKIIAGNWKMNKTVGETRAMLSELKELVSDVNSVEIVVGVPFTALEAAVETVKGSNIDIAAQNMYPKDSGAYTGEISPVMLKDLGVKYVILGHSERREYFKESNKFINEKVKSALAHDLIPILCIGEKLEDRESGKTNEVNEKQLREGLEDLTSEEAAKVVVAYEPVWAIGTGKTATPEMAEETHAEIRAVLADMFGRPTAEKITIQYGGSMNPGNAKSLMKQPDIDGGLVGGASLEAKSFNDVIKAGL